MDSVNTRLKMRGPSCERDAWRTEGTEVTGSIVPLLVLSQGLSRAGVQLERVGVQAEWEKQGLEGQELGKQSPRWHPSLRAKSRPPGSWPGSSSCAWSSRWLKLNSC